MRAGIRRAIALLVAGAVMVAAPVAAYADGGAVEAPAEVADAVEQQTSGEAEPLAEDARADAEPVDEESAAEAAVEAEPTEDAPVEESPVEQAPAEQVPTAQAPTAQAPTKQAPTAQAPVELPAGARSGPVQDDSRADGREPVAGQSSGAELVTAAIRPGEWRQVPFDVVDAVHVRAAVLPPNGVAVRITGPGGVATAWQNGSHIHNAPLAAPVTGRFLLEFRNDSDQDALVRYDLSFIRAGEIALGAAVSNGRDILEVTGSLGRAGSAISGAHVSAVLTGPNGVSAPYPMLEVSPGLYRSVIERLPAGWYTVLVRATVDGVTHTEASFGNTSSSGAIPPSVALASTPAVPGESGWYRTSVYVDVTADHPDGVQWVRHIVNADPVVQTAGRSAQVLLSRDGEHLVSAWAADRLNTTSDPVERSVRIDRTAPAIARHGVLDAGEVASGESTVADFTCEDATSGVARCVMRLTDGTELAPGESLDTSAPGSVEYVLLSEDRAGNTAMSEGSLEVTGDVTPPTIVVLTDPAASNARGWFARDVLVTITASDPGSGVSWVEYRVGEEGDWTRMPGNEVQIPVQADGTTTIGYRASDGAGNVTGDRSRSINLDRVAPVVQVDPAIDGAQVARGERLPASFACTDAHAGVLECTGTATGTGPVANGDLLPTDAEGTFVFTASAVDRAGNDTTVRAQYTVGPAPVPTATATALVPANEHGWWNDDVEIDLIAVPETGAVTVHWELEGAQTGNGSADELTTVTITEEGDSRLNYWAEDVQGGRGEPMPFDVQVDKTAPVVSYAGLASDPAETLTLVQGEELVLSVVCEDPGTGAGIDTCASPFAGGAAVPTDRLGESAYTTTAVDRAGNVTTSIVAVRVIADDGEEPGGNPGGEPGGDPGEEPGAEPGGRAPGGDRDQVDGLAVTGSDGLGVATAAAAALAMLGLGAAGVLVARRRNSVQRSGG